jgi:hypothetical protein
LAGPVLERFGQREPAIDRGANRAVVPTGVHRRQRQRLLENHLRSRAIAGIVDNGQGPFAEAPALFQQR